MFEISTDFQRINHYIADIGKHVVRLSNAANAPCEVITDVARLTEMDLQRAVSAYKDHDIFLARTVQIADDEFERLYSAGIKALQSAIRKNPDVLTAATELLFVFTSLQRIGEHASSIAWHAEEMAEEEP